MSPIFKSKFGLFSRIYVDGSCIFMQNSDKAVVNTYSKILQIFIKILLNAAETLLIIIEALLI